MDTEFWMDFFSFYLFKVIDPLSFGLHKIFAREKYKIFIDISL